MSVRHGPLVEWPIFFGDMHEELLENIAEIVSPVLNRLGYELVDAELVFEGAQILRIYIDKEGGVTIADCEVASRSVGDSLDAEDIIPFRYRLEVSSPGLDRPLKTPTDFEKYRGNTVKIRTKQPIDGRSNYKGEIKEVTQENISVVIDGDIYQVPYAKILKARLVPDYTLKKRKT